MLGTDFLTIEDICFFVVQFKPLSDFYIPPGDAIVLNTFAFLKPFW